MASTIQFFATTPKGMEALLAAELRDQGASSVEERRAGVAFSGPLAAGYRACLWSRTANRVLLPLSSFPAPDEESLYAGARAIPWLDHLSAKQTLAVDFSASESRITHTHYGALKTKDAIVDRIRDETGARPSVQTVRPDVRVNVYLHRDAATVSIDLSGESLHRRGYRETGAPAPLKENLAAAILLLAEWPRLARAGVPLLDPMCGSATLPIEAALMAADIAPGLRRDHFGFLGWIGHQPAIWGELLAEAREREIRDVRRMPPIVGHDADGSAVRLALECVEKAGLRGRVHVERRDLASCEPVSRRDRGEGDPALPRGLLVANPPYGERLGEQEALGPLYEQLGDTLKRRFPGWTGYVFTGNPDLAKRIGLRAARRVVLYNGAIECRLLELPISREPIVEREGATGPSWRRPVTRKPAPESAAFANRVTKNLRHLRKWAKREDVHCFRVYDADLPEYAVAIDLYEDAAHVQEYEPPATVNPEKAEARLADVVALVPEALGVAAEDVHLKVRRRQRGADQYERLADERAFRIVREGGHRFLVNLRDYLDTGLFLDHRRIRSMIGERARGVRFLNLFCYTGTATVYAARAGASSTTSVDLSNTYLDWARRNLELNEVAGREHRFVRADCLEWIEAAKAGHERYGLIFLAPPTFSNSKGMQGTFDVQRDHAELLRAVAVLLEPDGELIFSNNFRRFKMDREALPGLRVEEITARTIPPDFARDARIHNAWRITLGDPDGKRS